MEYVTLNKLTGITKLEMRFFFIFYFIWILQRLNTWLTIDKDRCPNLWCHMLESFEHVRSAWEKGREG